MESFSSWVAGPGQVILPLAAACVVIVACLVTRRSSFKEFTGRITLDVALTVLGIMAYILTFGFTKKAFRGVDSEMVPRIWAIVLTLLGMTRLVFGLMRRDPQDPSVGRLDKAALLLGLLILKFVGISWLGYFISAGLFVFFCGLLLGYKDLKKLALVAGTWVLFSYFMFYKLLHVPLDTGKLLAAIFG